MNDLSQPVIANAPVLFFRKRELALCLCAFGLLIALRLPTAWAEGRFVAEEATVFLSYAWNFPADDALLRSFGGYLNLAANGAGVLVATLVKGGVLGLAEAPYLTMILGLGFQLAPVFLLLTGSASWLPNRRARLVAAAMVVLAPSTEEVYLNIMHIQFHLALCVAILLGLDEPKRTRARWGYGLVLVFAPLCGPGAIVFLPLFVARAIIDRSRERACQSLLLGLGTALQLLLFYEQSPIRGLPTAPIVLGASLFIRLIVLPLGGPIAAILLGIEAADASDAAGSGSTLLLFLAASALVLFAGLAWWCLRKRDSAIWLLSAALLVAVVSLGLGIASRPDAAARAVLVGMAGPRYNFIPLVLLGLTMLALASRKDGTGRKVAVGLIFCNLLVSAFLFRMTMAAYSNGPSWKQQVRLWEANPDHPLAVWPRPFAADLSGRARPCLHAPKPPGDPSDPPYCENGWLAGFYPHKPKPVPLDPKSSR